MIFIFPMAGKGSRFFDAGYTVPKYMLEANGKSLFEYSLNSLPIDIADKVIFIGLKEHEDDYKLTEFIENKTSKYGLKDKIEVILLDEVTRGQAETVLKAEKYIEPEKDVVIYNIDTYFQSKNLKEMLLDENLKRDGILSAFFIENPDNKWSYAKLNDKDLVEKTTEKVPISNFALTGMYHFSKGKDFINVAKKCISGDIKSQGEFYIAPMYNELIGQGKEFVVDVCEEFKALGTPEDLKNAF